MLDERLMVRNLFSVKGKIVLITGAGGIGECLAKGFLGNEATVIVTNRTEEKKNQALEKFKAQGYSHCDGFAMDQTCKNSVEKVIDQILEKYRRIDVLINAVGYSFDAKPEDFPEEEIKKIMEINVTSAMLINQIVAKKAMIPQSYGKIINIGSIGGIMCHSENVYPYEASKAALHQMTKSLALNWAKYHINVNCIAPTWVKTSMTNHYEDNYFDLILKMHYFDRLSEAEDYVGPAIFLSSDASAYVSGLILVADGAWTCGRTVSHECGYSVINE